MQIFKFLFLFLFITAQSAQPSENGAWTLYTNANSAISSIAMDGAGALWFGTQDGVSCFDGAVWKSWTSRDGLADSNVYTVAIDSKGVKWFGTKTGVSRFDGASWKTYTTADGLADNQVYAIVEDLSGALWFGTGLGLSCFDGKSWKTYTTRDGLARNSVQAIAVDDDGSLWVGSNMGGVSNYDGMSWYIYSEMKAYPIYSISVNRNGTKWFCGSYGAASFNGLSWKFFTSKNSPLYNAFSTTSDREGVQWFGSSTGSTGKVIEAGPISFDGVSWKILPMPRPETNQITITALVWDTGGDLWVGTYAGLYRYSPHGEHPLAVKISLDIPSAFAIFGNYPNPFNPATTISFTLPETGQAGLAIYNVSGQKVRELASGTLAAGRHSVVWDGRDGNGSAVSSGVYISRLMMKDKATASRMLLVK